MNVGPTNAVATPDREVPAHLLEGVANDAPMVEGQLDRAVASRPTPGTSAASAASVPAASVAHVPHHGEVPDRHDVHARVATRVAVRAELGQRGGGVDPGLLRELPPGCLVQRLRPGA